MTQDTLQTEIGKGIGTIRMNRPDVHNAFDDGLISALTAELMGTVQGAGSPIAGLTVTLYAVGTGTPT